MGGAYFDEAKHPRPALGNDPFLRRNAISRQVGFGSFATERPSSGYRPMSAILPIATEIARRCNVSRWANRRHPRIYSITSSAIASKLGGMSRPIALAVLRLITNSNLVGC